MHRALNMGSPSMVISRALFEELQLSRREELKFRLGDLPMSVAAREVSTNDMKPIRLETF